MPKDVHKEEALDNVERLYPARRYVMIDDKLRILDALKRHWKDRVTTVFPKQGHYARDPKALAAYRPADISIACVGDLLNQSTVNLCKYPGRRSLT